MDYNQVLSENVSYFENIVSKYNLEIGIDQMISEFSGIFLTHNSYVEQELTFRLMGTYATKKGERTKKKQLFSLGLKNIKKFGNEESAHIRNEFEKLIFIFTQMKNFEEIKLIEAKKEDLQNN